MALFHDGFQLLLRLVHNSSNRAFNLAADSTDRGGEVLLKDVRGHGGHWGNVAAHWAEGQPCGGALANFLLLERNQLAN
jgi:hypothetical protein